MSGDGTDPEARATVARWHRARTVFDRDVTRALDPVVDDIVRGALARGDRPSETPLETLHRSTDPSLQLAVAGAWAERVSWRQASTRQGHTLPDPMRRNAEPPARPVRLRLCYVGAEVGEFAAAGPIRDLFRHHDRDRVEVTLAALNPDDGSPWRRWAEATVDRFLDLSSVPVADRAAQLGATEPDAVVDLSGWTRPESLHLAAATAAPVRLGYLGFPGSSGAPWVSHLVGDAVTTPDSLAPHLAEKRLLLPSGFLPADGEAPSHPRRWSRAALGLPDDAVVLAAFNSTRKLTDRFFRAAATILRRLPGGVLWLLADGDEAERNIVRALPAFGIDRGRVVFARRLRFVDHMDRLPHADLGLDSLGYAGGATTGMSLVAGLPVVTAAGPTMVSRLGAGQVTAAGFPELVAADDQDFVERAVALAADRARLDDLRRRLASTVRTSPLCDITALARGLERGIDMAYAQAAHGEAADIVA